MNEQKPPFTTIQTLSTHMKENTSKNSNTTEMNIRTGPNPTMTDNNVNFDQTAYVTKRENSMYSRFHLSKGCAGNKNSHTMSLREAATGHIPCGNCVPEHVQQTVKEEI